MPRFPTPLLESGSENRWFRTPGSGRTDLFGLVVQGGHKADVYLWRFVLELY